MRLGVEKATRTPPAAPSATNRNEKHSSRTTRPLRNGVKPTRRGMRPITPTNGRDPWSGATSRRHDHPWSSSAYEIRAFSHDDACWVEMYVSRLSPDVTYKAIGSNSVQARGVVSNLTTLANFVHVIRRFDPCGKRATLPAPPGGGDKNTQHHKVTRVRFSTWCGSSVDDEGGHDDDRHDEQHRCRT